MTTTTQPRYHGDIRTARNGGRYVEVDVSDTTIEQFRNPVVGDTVKDTSGRLYTVTGAGKQFTRRQVNGHYDDHRSRRMDGWVNTGGPATITRQRFYIEAVR